MKINKLNKIYQGWVIEIESENFEGGTTNDANMTSPKSGTKYAVI